MHTPGKVCNSLILVGMVIVYYWSILLFIVCCNIFLHYFFMFYVMCSVVVYSYFFGGLLYVTIFFLVYSLLGLLFLGVFYGLLLGPFLLPIADFWGLFYVAHFLLLTFRFIVNCKFSYFLWILRFSTNVLILFLYYRLIFLCEPLHNCPQFFYLCTITVIYPVHRIAFVYFVFLKSCFIFLAIAYIWHIQFF